MNIIAIYIFRSDGIPLISRFYDTNAKTVDGLVAPFLASTINRMEEITGSNMNEINMSDNIYLFLEQFAEIITVIVTNEKGSTPLDLDLVSRRFYKRFHKDVTGRGWRGQVDKLEQFFPEMEKLLGIEADLIIKKTPTEVLDAFIMADYDKNGQIIIKELIKMGELSTEKGEELIGKDQFSKLIDDLIEKGFVGIKQNNTGDISYFT